ncbi:hypothetical protein CYMTET_18446 [Cymbomonas tetramitiformis]|uniref:Uncharacterized protein n=1 Tax=Cymbomonas tetramitiformis TaxID=36881 RepID=A0AAE0G9F1_9CHLO|nr:hypothetical protein CYMTET_18446 [Cymbomonas tetramitiformis]
MGANKLLPASPTASAAPYPMDKPPQSVQEAPGSDANKLPPVLSASPPAPAVPHPTINPRLNANQVPGGDVNELLVPTPSAPAAPPLTSTHPLSAQVSSGEVNTLPPATLATPQSSQDAVDLTTPEPEEDTAMLPLNDEQKERVRVVLSGRGNLSHNCCSQLFQH